MSVGNVDADVVSIAVMAVQQRLSVYELWCHCATNMNFRLLAGHDITRTLCPKKCHVLPCTSLPSMVVIQCRTLDAGVRKLHGKHEHHMMASLLHSVLWVLPQIPTP